MNKVILIWNITQDLELKETPNWKSVLSFSIATNKRVKVWDNYENKWEFHNLVAWNKTAELIEKYQSKWSKVWIEWEIQTRNWEDKDTGKKIYRTEIIVNNVEFLSAPKKGNDEFEDLPEPKAKVEKTTNQNDINVEDIPF